VLRSTGHETKSREILYAGRAREHRVTLGAHSWTVSDIRQWMWLSLKWLFIGYGYKIHFSLYWIVALILLGMFALQLSGQGPAKGLRFYGIAYSIDMLMPIVELRKHHYDIELDSWVRGYFYVHKVFGYILPSFLIAGISGLTK
jgi:hypothetical protein